MGTIKLSIPDEHLRAIGLVSVNFALLENALAHLAWELLAVPRELGEAVTCELSFRNLVALVSSLYRHRATDPARIEACETLLTRASEVEAKRNAIVHSLWLTGGRPSAVVRVKVSAKKSRGLEYKTHEVRVEDLESTAEEAIVIAGQVLDLAVWRVLPVPTSPQHDEVGDDA